MTAATGTLGAAIKAIGIGGLMAGLIIPAAVIYGVYKLIDSFIGLGDVFEWLTGTAVDHTKTIEELTATYNELTAPDTGKMQKLYQEQADYELKILELKKDQNLSQTEINEKAAEYAEIQTRIYKEINAGNESIKRYAQTVLGAQIDSKRNELIETQKVLERTTTRGALLAGAGAIGDNPITGFLTAGALGDATKASEAYAEKINVVRMNMETLRLETVALQAEQARLLGTSRAFIESQGIKDTRIKSQIEDVTKEYEKQYEVREKIAGELDKAISANNKDEIARLQNELEAQTKLTDALSGRKSALEKLFETLQRIAKASDSSSPVQIETAEEMVKKLKSGFEQTISAVGRTQDELDALNLNATIIQAERLEEKTRAGFANLDAMLAAIKWSAEKNPAAVKVQLEALSNMYATIAGYASDHAKTMDSYLKIEELARKYDEASASAYELFEHSQNLAVLKVGKDWDIEKINRAFSEQLGTILKIDEQTGQLTETSKRAATELKNGILHEMERLRGEVAILNEDGLLQSELPQMQAVLGRIQALSDMFGVLDGDLAGLVIQQMQVKENTKDVNELYSDQAEILKLLGANTAALTTQRKAETKEVTGLAKKLKDFKFLLEDLNELQDKLTETADFTSQMDEAYASMDADMISKFGTGMAEWYNPTDAIGKIDSLKSSLRESMGATTELGQTAAQTFDDLFTQLETRLRVIVSEAKTGMTALSEQMSNISIGSDFYSHAQSVDTSSGAGVAAGFSASVKSSHSRTYQTPEITALLDAATEKYDLPDQLIHVIKRIESGKSTNLNLVGYTGDHGLMQFSDGKMVDFRAGKIKNPVTGKAHSLDFNSAQGQIDAAGALIKNLLIQSGGDIRETLTKYNQGEGKTYATASKHGKEYANKGLRLLGMSKSSTQVESSAASVVAGTSAIADNMDRADSYTEQMANSLGDTTVKAGALSVANEDSAASLQKQVGAIGGIEARMVEINKLQLDRDNLWAELETAYKSATSDNNLTADETTELTAIYSRYSSVVDELNNKRQSAKILDEKELVNQKKLRAEYQYSKEELLAMADSYGSTTTALSNYQVEYNKIIQLMQAGLLSEDQAFDLLEEKALAVLATQGDWAEYWAELKGGLQDFSELSIDVFDEFKDTLVDAIVDGKADFSGFVDSIKRKLAELAVNTIVVNVIGSVTGLSGTLSGLTATGATGSSAAGAASSLGSLSSLSSLLSLSSWKNGLSNTWGSVKNGLSWLSGGTPATQTSNIYGAPGYGSSGAASINWANLGSGLLGGTAGYFLSDALFDGDYVGIGSSIGGAAGTAMGTTLATAFSVAGPVGTAIGALLGSVAGGGLASLFGNSEPEFGGYQMSFSGLGFEEDVSAKGAFGLSFGATGTGTHNMDMSEYQDIFDGFAGMTTVLADFYGNDLEGKVKNAIWSQIGDYKKLSKDTSTALGQVFTMISEEAVKAEEDLDGPAHALAAAVEQAGGLTALGDSATEMTYVIQGGIEAATYAAKLFNTETGRLMGLGIDEEFDSIVESAKALTWYVQAFWEEGETTESMIVKFVDTLNVLNLAVTMTSGNIDGTANALENLGFSALELMIIADDLRATIEATGMTLADFSELQSSYYTAAYSEAERAQHQADAARRSIAAWNTEMGFTGDAYISNIAELRKYIEGLDEYSPDYNELYVEAIKASGAFVLLAEALGEASESATDLITDFVSSITPDAVLLSEMMDVFAEYGMSMPSSTDQLYEWIQAGLVADDLLLYLAKNTDQFNSALSALSSIQSQLLDDLSDKYDEVVDAAEQRSDDIIEALQETYDANLEALEDAYDLRVEQINDEIDALEELIDVVESSAADAMESLKQQTEGPDITRLRYLDMAEAAIEQYTPPGSSRTNIQDIISQLGQVDANDFTTREDWLAAIAENESMSH
jgi:hypothetical protein